MGPVVATSAGKKGVKTTTTTTTTTKTTTTSTTTKAATAAATAALKASMSKEEWEAFSTSKGFDPRHPLYLGSWKRSIVGVDEDVTFDDLDEPHLKRKQTILALHPEISKLYGYTTSTKWICLGYVLLQLTLAYGFGRILPDWSVGWLLAGAYLVGGTVTSIFGVIIHEATHDLCFEARYMNRAVGFLANVCIPFPIYSSFRRYHLEHHAFQGVEGKDPDLPLAWEVRLIKGNPLQKAVFLFFYPLMYVARGAAQNKTPTFWELMNWAFTITTDIIIWNVCGPKGLFYLFMSLWLGYGLHPAAAHFIQEHFTFNDGQETYSYYGASNPLFLNIGFHNEHHDFMTVAWDNLPEVKRIAPEFYDNLVCHMSWVNVLYRFLFDSTVGPQSRVVRTVAVHKQGRKMIVEARRAGGFLGGGRSKVGTASKGTLSHSDSDSTLNCSAEEIIEHE